MEDGQEPPIAYASRNLMLLKKVRERRACCNIQGKEIHNS